MKPLRKQTGWDVIYIPYENMTKLITWHWDMILEGTQRSVEDHCEIVDHNGMWLTEALYDYLDERGF